MNVFYQDKYKGGYSFKVALKFKEMRYSKEIVNQIKIIDEVLYSLNLPSILKNEYFVTDAISCENYLKLHYNKPNNIFFQ